MIYTFETIAAITDGTKILGSHMQTIEYLIIDSRRIHSPATSLFFALQSPRRNGEDFVEELYNAGVKAFVVTERFNHEPFTGANFLKVPNTLRCLQHIASFHRQQFNLPVIGITGSNGKTIIKEWLYQLLHADYNIIRSPKSYNSQIGVPLSVWGIQSANNLGIFEAGISEENEMEYLENIIRPDIGILTNLGAAHNSGFVSEEHKLQEKWKLFKKSTTVICSNLNPIISNFIETIPREQLFIWGNGDVDLNIINIEKKAELTIINALFESERVEIVIPFTDNASVENAINCLSVLLLMKVNHAEIISRMIHLQPVEMRLQLKKANNNCSIINDTYSNDISSLRIALDFLQQQSGNQFTRVILSDLGDVGSSENLYQKISEALVQHNVKSFTGIGPRLCSMHQMFKDAIPDSTFYVSVQEFIEQFSIQRYHNEIILLKGARSFEFERIGLLFEQKVHQTVLEVNLTALMHNLKEYQNYLKPDTKVMAMVKAFSYGSGSAEVARILQFQKVDYLAVAYADEGVELRKAAIHLPIIVMNPETVTFQLLVDHNLEPELYSFDILQKFNDFIENEGLTQYPVHIKLDTGMHRLGFEIHETAQLANFLQQHPKLKVLSVFSHLAGSENEQHDKFTALQAEQFSFICQQLQNALGYTFLQHISNSAAIFRHPQYQFDMVRLGIGLYGVDSIGESKLNLMPVVSLKTTVAQVRKVKAGESIGYGRKGKVDKDSVIATIRIGYADGFSRRLGMGVGKVYAKGQMAPVIGNVCMDMTMIDVTEINDLQEGDIVEIFGTHIPIQQVAQWCETIPYEIMTGISQRVKREYFEE